MANILHQRRTTQIQGFDYSSPAVYFITAVISRRLNLLGEVKQGEMKLNPYGEIVSQSWLWLSDQYAYIELHDWIVMPNHFHGILQISDFPDYPDRGESRLAPIRAGSRKIKPLGQLIGAFKTRSAKQINLLRGTPGKTVWQRDFYRHIIQNEAEWQHIHEYIVSNPQNYGKNEHP